MQRLQISIFIIARIVSIVGRKLKRGGVIVFYIMIISQAIRRQEKFVKDVHLTKV
tara:strand:- start:3363 stop:3527 length:165 start_codon:yes stop_codon:yes gene_type:complete